MHAVLSGDPDMNAVEVMFRSSEVTETVQLAKGVLFFISNQQGQ